MAKMDYIHGHTKPISSGLVEAGTQEYTLTPRAWEHLNALFEVGKWIGRSELATRLNKNALNKWDIRLLSKLADAGLIETRRIPHHGPIGYEWQYRALSKNQS